MLSETKKSLGIHRHNSASGALRTFVLASHEAVVACRVRFEVGVSDRPADFHRPHYWTRKKKETINGLPNDISNTRTQRMTSFRSQILGTAQRVSDLRQKKAPTGFLVEADDLGRVGFRLLKRAALEIQPSALLPRRRISGVEGDTSFFMVPHGALSRRPSLFFLLAIALSCASTTKSQYSRLAQPSMPDKRQRAAAFALIPTMWCDLTTFYGSGVMPARNTS